MKNTIFIVIIFTFLILWNSLFAQSYMDTARKAEQLRTAGKFVEVAELYEAYITENGPDPIVYYSAACHWSLAGELDKAFKALTEAVENGLYEKDWIEHDDDFANLKNDERYSQLMSLLDNKIEKLLSELPYKHEESDKIILPEPQKESEHSIEAMLEIRRSIRNYTSAPLSLQEVSQLLWAAYGINKPIPDAPYLRGGLKTTPSAGATYPLEIYLVCGNVTDLLPGVYKYKPEDHSLFTVLKKDLREDLYMASLQQPWVLEAPASLVYSAVFSRTTDIYGSRGKERYVCMDVGHSAENVYLQAGALNIGTVAIGAFSDLNVKLLLNMTREEEPLYIMPIGKIK